VQVADEFAAREVAGCRECLCTVLRDSFGLVQKALEGLHHLPAGRQITFFMHPAVRPPIEIGPVRSQLSVRGTPHRLASWTRLDWTLRLITSSIAAITFQAW